PDRATARLMCAVHRRLAEGDDPATALAAAGTAPDLDGPADRLAAAAFVCLGSDPAFAQPAPAAPAPTRRSGQGSAPVEGNPLTKSV
ncbi:MAG TPA: hypothetical protein VF076_05435, partial [Acidimicrobiales bacterium]